MSTIMKAMDVRYKTAEAEDIDKLWPLVKESLVGSETKLTRDKLEENLCGKVELNANNLANFKVDSAIELDLNRARPTYPTCYALVAQVDGKLVGYLIFHQYYSVWDSRSAFVTMIYVSPAFRGKGIATGFWFELCKFCRREQLAYVVYETSRIDRGLKDSLAKNGSFIFRDDNANWSAYMMDLRQEQAASEIIS